MSESQNEYGRPHVWLYRPPNPPDRQAAASERNVVQPSQLVRALQWIFEPCDPTTLLDVTRTVASDLHAGRPPVVADVRGPDGTVRAACLFRHLPGNVAALSGLRVAPNSATQQANSINQALTECIGELSKRGIRQIQAVIEESDLSKRGQLLRCGFEQVAQVEQRVLQLDRLLTTPRSSRQPAFGQPQPLDPSTCQVRESLSVVAPPDDEQKAGIDVVSAAAVRFMHASTLSQRSLERLIAETFLETRDCPVLNDLRDPSEFLHGFLEGNQLNSQLPWYVALVNDEVAGCVFLHYRPHDVTELIYMGLASRFRGQGLGKRLGCFAVQVARDAGAAMLVTAVDAANLPAVRIYRRLGFRVSQRFSVLLASASLQRAKTRRHATGA